MIDFGTNGQGSVVVSLRKYFPVSLVVGLLLPDYLSLFETRLMLRVLRRFKSFSWSVLVLLADAAITGVTSLVGAIAGTDYASAFYRDDWTGRLLDLLTLPGLAVNVFDMPIRQVMGKVMLGPVAHHGYESILFYPGLFSCLWLWLYAGSGFLLKFARRFDVGFDWFNRKFDIEKKPLSAIGLVAGCIVAVLWWGVVVVRMI
jgi:hypothetical protein